MSQDLAVLRSLSVSEAEYPQRNKERHHDSSGPALSPFRVIAWRASHLFCVCHRAHREPSIWI